MGSIWQPANLDQFSGGGDGSREKLVPGASVFVDHATRGGSTSRDRAVPSGFVFVLACRCQKARSQPIRAEAQALVNAWNCVVKM